MFELFILASEIFGESDSLNQGPYCTSDKNFRDQYCSNSNQSTESDFKGSSSSLVKKEAKAKLIDHVAKVKSKRNKFTVPQVFILIYLFLIL